ncbi:MAG TPA: hypothetical protein VMG99_08750 [Thermoplasmata archaeon]|nr:hypothetical protein [Thermoplasmata archaeon]
MAYASSGAYPVVPGASPGPSQQQFAPTRYFVLDPIPPFDPSLYIQARDTAYLLLAQKVVDMGQIPSAYDVRPINPYDDFALLQGTVVDYFNDDWSIGSAHTGTDNTGSFSGTGNQILSGQFPQNRAAVFWGIAIETPGTPYEVWWKFYSGANVKQIFMLQELLSFQNPRAVSRQVPTYGASDLINLVLGNVGSGTVVDVFLTLWAEPTATTITAGALQA